MELGLDKITILLYVEHVLVSDHDFKHFEALVPLVFLLNRAVIVYHREVALCILQVVHDRSEVELGVQLLLNQGLAGRCLSHIDYIQSINI